MFIKQDSIDQVRDLNIVDVIRNSGVELKKQGVSFKGLCPFHNEKSPSFTVSEQKQFYKCFGCGKGGDVISYIVDHEKLSFFDAVEWLAKENNITLEYDKEVVETQEQKDYRQQLKDLIKICNRKYQEKLYKLDDNGILISNPALVYLMEKRKLTVDSIVQWQLGYAPDENRFLTQLIVDRGYLKPANEIGIIKTKQEANYDAFRNRVMFPVHDKNGEVVGFGARMLPAGDKDADLKLEKQYGKYHNSSDSVLYNKSKLLYGLHFADRSIRHNDFAVLVEGNVDVISFHQAGVTNTVASCGTALTDEQCKLLKKSTSNVIVCRDGDSAGMNACLRDINLLLKHGFKTDVFLMPEGQDPDSFAQQFMSEIQEPSIKTQD